MDYRIDPSVGGLGIADPDHLAEGTAASSRRDAFSPTINGLEPEPVRNSDEAMTLVMGDGDNSEWVSSILRASSLAIIVFQIGYIVLDGGEYPQTFARTLPLHIASMIPHITSVALGCFPSMFSRLLCAQYSSVSERLS